MNLIPRMPMTVMMYLATSLLALPVLFRAAYSYFQRPWLSRQCVSSLEEINRLLDPIDVSIADQLASRARANRRLAVVLGIHNSFTDSNVQQWKIFRLSAISCLKRTSGRDGMQLIKTAAEEAVTQRLAALSEWNSPCSHPEFAHATRFDEFIQYITFCTVFNALFAVDVSLLQVDQVTYVTQGINSLWCNSKRRDPDPTDRALLARIKAQIQSWLPEGSRIDDVSQALSQNPLDIIIPAFETLWRVVAHTFVQANESALVALPLREYFQCLENFGGDDMHPGMFAAEKIVTEALRLHPPTRRISRYLPRLAYIQTAFPSTFRHAAADIEALHRSPSIWGNDALEFVPNRESKTNACDAFMPFGKGPLKCVATQWAPRVVAVITGAILARGGSFSVGVGSGAGGRDGWDGWMIRNVGQ